MYGRQEFLPSPLPPAGIQLNISRHNNVHQTRCGAGHNVQNLYRSDWSNCQLYTNAHGWGPATKSMFVFPLGHIAMRLCSPFVSSLQICGVSGRAVSRTIAGPLSFRHLHVIHPIVRSRLRAIARTHCHGRRSRVAWAPASAHALRALLLWYGSGRADCNHDLPPHPSLLPWLRRGRGSEARPAPRRIFRPTSPHHHHCYRQTSPGNCLRPMAVPARHRLRVSMLGFDCGVRGGRVGVLCAVLMRHVPKPGGQEVHAMDLHQVAPLV